MSQLMEEILSRDNIRTKGKHDKDEDNKASLSKISRVWFCENGWKMEARPHKDSLTSFEQKLKKLTRRSWSISMDERIKRLNWVIRGWINYYRIWKMKTNLIRIDGQLRTKMRIVIWKQWKTGQKRYWGLRKLGAPKWMARQSAGFGDHYQAVTKTSGVLKISKEILAERGLISCIDYYLNWTA